MAALRVDGGGVHPVAETTGLITRLTLSVLRVVMHVDADPEDAVLVRGAIELGHNLGMSVVAEGAEGATHVAALQAPGCDAAQGGGHDARPMPPADLTAWLRAGAASAAPAGWAVRRSAACAGSCGASGAT
ncbi:EAL domain-containing protein [Dactylosporangium sp. NPDC005555]|uniref:EAL domain-containing protein n=1 Tax=Dactylosporangium sp. NPDC005555 TaxID=3154889 RepID=UPI0033AA4663